MSKRIHRKIFRYLCECAFYAQGRFYRPNVQDKDGKTLTLKTKISMEKTLYEAPSVLVMELRATRIFLGSEPNVSGNPVETMGTIDGDWDD